MSNLSQFTNKQNLKLLWEVLLDELNISNSNKNQINNIKTVFDSNISPFSSRINPKLSIIELNKQFLSQLVLAVNRLFPNLKQDQNIKRITIFPDEDISEPYKIEDIQASRQNDFEKELEKKRLEMENYMTPQKPKELDFSDKNSDSKIKAMDSLVAEKMVERNFEIESLQNGNYNITNINPEKWLTPRETSIKNEKMIVEPKVIEKKPIIKNNQNSRLKHISIDNNNNIKLLINEQEPSLKKVSWDDSSEIPLNIFSKLKKQPMFENTKHTVDIDENQYVEQKSMPLPDIKKEEIIRNQITLPVTNNEPIIPKTEIIKQLNEMNKKIDNLYEMMSKLILLMNKNNKDDNHNDNYNDNHNDNNNYDNNNYDNKEFN